MSGHHRPNRGETDVWLTPPEIISALGPFDLDPCAEAKMPWKVAKRSFTIEDNGLEQTWDGFVWLNPPYSDVWDWLTRLADHGNGVALIFARTETAGFFSTVWDRADSLLFLKGRLHFHYPDGHRAPFNAGAPSVLIGYGPTATARLAQSGLEGSLVTGWRS